MANVKFIAVSRGLRGIVDYVTNREKTVEQLISGVNCVARTAVPEFEAVKKQFRKTEGRGYYHIVQAFAPDDPLDFATAHELGVKLAEHFAGYQCIVVTHMNTAHIHNHIIMNSVNFETGMKFHQPAREMQQVMDYCNQLCREYGLSVTESKADPFRIPTWKRRLTDHIKEAILNEAAVRAAFTRKTGIDMEDMVSVVLKQQYGAQEDMPRVSDEVIEKVALHEAGHLVVCEALCPGSVGFASLLPSDENRCGGFIHCCKGVSDSQSAIIALGGKAAVETRYAGQVAEGCSDDIACAVNCIREAAAKEGTLGFSLLNVESDSSSDMSESLNARSEAAVQAELERYYGKARALLAQNEAFLKEITEALVMKKTLLYSDIQAIRGTAVKRNPAVTCEAASRYDAAEIENSPPEDPEEAMRQKIMRKLEEAERRRCS